MSLKLSFCHHSLLFFHPLSPFFLQEPQTTVIHNPVDGTKVHPPPLPPSLKSSYLSSLLTGVLTVRSLSVWLINCKKPVGFLCSVEVLSVRLRASRCVLMHAGTERAQCLVVSHCPFVFRWLELSGSTCWLSGPCHPTVCNWLCATVARLNVLYSCLRPLTQSAQSCRWDCASVLLSHTCSCFYSLFSVALTELCCRFDEYVGMHLCVVGVFVNVFSPFFIVEDIFLCAIHRNLLTAATPLSRMKTWKVNTLKISSF